MSTFTAAAIIPAYEDVALDLGVSIQRVSYLTSLQIAVLGAAPLIWRPLSQRYGRRPIFLLSLLCACVCNISCAKSPSYASMATCCALQAVFISPAVAIGSGVVVETFFKRQRARYMGIWTVMVTLGVPMGPFIFGFVAQRVGYRWIFWVLAVVNVCQLILYLFLGPETRYLGPSHSGLSTFRSQYMSIRRIDSTPFSLAEIVHPLRLVVLMPVLVATVSYSTVFLFASVMGSVEVPQLLQAKFDLNAQQVGLQFLGLVVGTLIGEIMGGHMPDMWMIMRTKQLGTRQPPEFRLWLSYVGYLMTIAGMVVFLVCTQTATQGHWTVSPVVGLGIAAFGNQVVTTVMVTYAVDVHPEEAASIGVFVSFIRSEWGFIGPFWYVLESVLRIGIG
jgi:MFS family permease